MLRALPLSYATSATGSGWQQGVRAELIPLLLYAGQHGILTNTVVQRQLGVSKPTATHYLGELEQGLFSATQRDARGRYGIPIDWLLIGSPPAGPHGQFLQYTPQRGFLQRWH